jgi:PAS domain S-box-containing protein
MRTFILSLSRVLQTGYRRLTAHAWLSSGTFWATLLLCLTFYISALVGLALHFPKSLVYFVWPPSVVLLVALLLAPPRIWWIFALTLFPVHMLVEWRIVAAPLGSIALFYAVVWAQALAGALCVARFARRPLYLTSLRNLVVFLLAGAGVAALAEGVTFVAVLLPTSPDLAIGLTFAQIFLAELLTMLVLAPALLAGWAVVERTWLASLETTDNSGVHGWLKTIQSDLGRWLDVRGWGRALEASLLALGLLGVGLIAFGGYVPFPSTLPALLYAVLPLLLWAAVRFGTGGTSLALCGLTLLSIIYAIHGRGPFSTFSTTADLFSLQLFFIAISIPLLVLAVLMYERRQAQEGLQQSEARYRAVVQNFPHGAVLLFDTQLRHLFADGQGVRENEWLAQAAAGGTVWDAFPTPLAAGLVPRYQAAIAGIPATFDLRANERTYYVQTLPVHQIQGTVGMAVLQDVTEQRRAEALVELDRAKTVFFSNVSHELRTPLTLLLGPAADALADREEPLPPRQRERLELIQRGGLRLHKLVNSLLDFSRIEAGRIQATYEPTDLPTLTAELASTFRSAAERAGLELVVACPPLTPLVEPVYVDREMWEKIVLNLLSNALKFTFDGTITVSLRPVDALPGAQRTTLVECEVHDTGTGIPAEELPHLFERFHRVEGARARTQEGTGIGLALVWELVRLHGGTVRARSTVGVGSTFTVAIPTGCGHLPADRIRDASHRDVRPPGSAGDDMVLGAAPYVEEALRWLPYAVEPAAVTSDVALVNTTMDSTRGVAGDKLPTDLSEAQGEHAGPPGHAAVSETTEPGTANTEALILVADDNADLRAYLTRLLGARWTVEGAADGISALAAARARPPDLVLADVMMPGLDGFALLRALRADSALRAIPVLLLSARVGEEATVEGLEAGADDYLIKPFTARELVARVQAHLELTHLRREAAEQAAQLQAIFEAQADGVAVFDLQGRFLRTNQALAQLFGYDASSSYTARPFAERAQRVLLFNEQGERIPAEQYPHWRVLRGELLAGASAMEARMRRLDGREIWISTTGAPIRSQDGQRTGVVLVTRDVTARRALEQQIYGQASELEAIFAAMADGVLVHDAEGHVVRVNQAYHHLLGLSADPDYVTQPLQERVRHLRVLDEHGQPISLEDSASQRVLRGEVLQGSTSRDVQMHTLDGRDIWVNTSGAPMHGPDGQITGVILISRDITVRRQLELRLAQQERLYRTLVENSPDVIARFDRDLRYLYVNPAIRRAFPIPPEAYLGKTNTELGWPEAVYAPVHRAIAQVFATGQSCTLEEIDDTTHPEHWYQARFVPEIAADDTVASVLTITTEITELKRTEEALREATAAAETARQREEQRRREAERREEIAESLRGVLAVLNSNRTLQEVLDHVVRQVGQLLGSEAAAIFAGDRNDVARGNTSASSAPLAETLTLQAAHGLHLARRRGLTQQAYSRLPFGHTAVQKALMSRQPVVVLRSGEPMLVGPAEDGAATGASIPVERGALPAPYQALLVVPIRVYDEVYGCLLLFSAMPRRFVDEEVALSLAYADQAGLAIANARLQAHIEQEAIAAERNRLARELHDTVTQDIFAASLLAESIPRNWQTQRAVAEASLQQLHGLTGGALAGLRVLLLELRPAELERMPLPQLLRQLGAAMSTRAAVAIAVEVEETNDRDGRDGAAAILPVEVKVALYRIAQEALTNAAKHAAARSIAVRLRTAPTGGLVLEIADDGRGFDLEAIPSGHFGLTMLRERAQAVGATVRVQSHPGQGTIVVVEWKPDRTNAPAPGEEAAHERVRTRTRAIARSRGSANSRPDRR